MRELGATLLTIAKDVKVQVAFNPDKVQSWRLIGYDNRRLATRDFDNDRKDAGELGAGHSVTFLYEIVPIRGGGDGGGGGDELLHLKLGYKRPDAHVSELLTTSLRGAAVPLAQTSDAFRFAASVAEVGLVLRRSRFNGAADVGAAIRRAKSALGDDRQGDRTGFLRLAERAGELAGRSR